MADEKADFKNIEAYKEFLSGLDDIAEFRDKKGDKYSESAKRINTFSYPSRENSVITREKGVPLRIAGNELLKHKEYKDEYFSNNPSHEIIKADGTKDREYSYRLDRESGAAQDATFLEALVAEFEVLANKEAEDKISEKEQGLLDAYRVFLTERTGMNEGGIAMDEQMDAVFKSSRTEVDPVSGNEVPPGSLPEEVRDDIPAMLSEGEYVVPADVLRFYGVKFFEDLRAQAKMGLAEMEANGRIGGEPIEEETGDVGISDEDLMVIMAQAPQEEQQVMANRGGLMGFQAGGLNVPAYIKQPDLTQFGMAGPDFTGGLEYRTYVNDAGMEITIPFFDGEPMGMIPPGYSLKGEVAQQEEAPQVSQDDDDPVRAAAPAQDTFDLDAIPTEELEKTAKGLSAMNSIATGIASAAGLPIAAIVNTAGVARYNDVLDRLKAEDPIAFEKSGLEKKGSIFGGESSLYENLKDRSDEQEGNKPGQDFGDTWLGDFLGFDGEAGVQGPKLRESIAGARRTGDGGTAASTPSSNNNDGPSPAPTPTVIPTGATIATGTVLNNPDDPVVSTIDDSGNEVVQNQSSLTEGQKAAMDWDE
jgi:hypothetical protein